MSKSEILQKCQYGIELETCVCMLNIESELTNDDALCHYLAELYEIDEEINTDEDEGDRLAKNIGIYLTNDMLDDISYKNEIDYTKWNLVIDGSVECKVGIHDDARLHYYRPNSKEKIANCTFYPIEIVSPILKFDEEPKFNTLSNFYENFIFNDRFVYMVNSSQGLHINISFKDIPLSDYIPAIIKYWIYYENVFFSFITEERQEDPRFSRRMTNLTTNNGKSVKDDWKNYFNLPDEVIFDDQNIPTKRKYVALNIKDNGNIIECRFIDGSISLEFIKIWTDLLINFLATVILSIINKDPDPNPNLDLCPENLFEFIYGSENSEPKTSYHKYKELIDTIENKVKNATSNITTFADMCDKCYDNANLQTMDKNKEDLEPLKLKYSEFLKESNNGLKLVEDFKQNHLPNSFPSISLSQIEDWENQFKKFKKLYPKKEWTKDFIKRIKKIHKSTLK
jgi:hypothetical protein